MSFLFIAAFIAYRTEIEFIGNDVQPGTFAKHGSQISPENIRYVSANGTYAVIVRFNVFIVSVGSVCDLHQTDLAVIKHERKISVYGTVCDLGHLLFCRRKYLFGRKMTV